MNPLDELGDAVEFGEECVLTDAHQAKLIRKEWQPALVQDNTR